MICHVREEVSLDFCADPASPVFTGHFPGAPVLPGAFLIDAALEAMAIGLGGAFEGGGFSLSQMRLQRPILPGDRGLLSATAIRSGTDDSGFWRISVSTGEVQAARFLIAPAPEPGAAETAQPAVPAMAALERNAIDRLLPHRPPMQLLDRAWRYDDGTVLGAHEVRPAECGKHGKGGLGVPFAIDGFLQAGGLLFDEGGARQQLLFGGVRRAQLAHLPFCGAILLHHLRPQHRTAGAVLLDGETWADGRRVAAYEGVTLAVRPFDLAAHPQAPLQTRSTVIPFDSAPLAAIA